MLNREEIREVVKETIKESICSTTCPWSGVSSDKIIAIDTIPVGALKMLCTFWNVVAKFGGWIGNGIAVGLFIILMAILFIGGAFLLKAWGLITGSAQ